MTHIELLEQNLSQLFQDQWHGNELVLFRKNLKASVNWLLFILHVYLSISNDQYAAIIPGLDSKIFK